MERIPILLALCLTTALPLASAVGGSCEDRETTTDDGQDYTHTTEECHEVAVHGDDVCVLEEETTTYHAENEGEDGWDDHTHHETESLACAHLPGRIRI